MEFRRMIAFIKSTLAHIRASWDLSNAHTDHVLEIRVRVRSNGIVDVVAPKGLQSTRIVAGRKGVPVVAGQRVAELLEDMLKIHGDLVSIADSKVRFGTAP